MTGFRVGEAVSVEFPLEADRTRLAESVERLGLEIASRLRQ